jgi:hypothetical protein
MRRFVLAAFALTVLAACQPATTELTEEQKAAISEELTQQYEGLLASTSQLSQEGFMGYFQNSHEITFAANGSFYRSHSALVDTVAAHWAPIASMEGNWGNLNIQVLAPNVAVATSVFNFTATDNAGATTHFTGTWTAVWVEREGAWKMVNVAETFPPAETPPEEG